MEVYRWKADVYTKGKSALNSCKWWQAREEAAFSVFLPCFINLIYIIKQGTQKNQTNMKNKPMHNLKEYILV